MSKEVAEEYLSSLADLTVNSKPLINMLTMLADENTAHAPAIVEVIENHIQKVSPEVKLPILYLIDSIIKNVSATYVPLFTQNIANIFVSVFEKVDEKTRLNMYKLRQTWSDIFPQRKMYALDVRVKSIDDAWPLTAPPPSSSIHLNPKFLANQTVMTEVSTAAAVESQKTATATTNAAPNKPVETAGSKAKETLLKQHAILYELQKKKLELELMQAKIRLQEQQQQQINQAGAAILGSVVNQPINEDYAKLLAQKAIRKPKAVLIPPSVDSTPKLMSAANITAPAKAKIAPANTQIIEAVKSRDPRIARKMLQVPSQPSIRQPLQPQAQAKGPIVASKEQEILVRQLAMLKTQVLDQVAQAAPGARLGNEANVKSHITINVDRNRDRIKKQLKDNNKSDSSSSSSSRNKLKSSSPRDSKSSPKSKSSRDNNRISSPKRSQKRCDSPVDRPRTPTKNERSLSPVPRNKPESKWSKHKSSPKKSSKSSRGYSPKRDRDNFPKSGSPSPKSDDKSGRRIKKKGKRDDSENDYDVIDVSPEKAKISPVKKEKSPPRLEVKNALPLKEKSPAKASSPKKEPVKSPQINQKVEDVENIPEIKSKSKDKRKDKSGKSELNRRGKKPDGSISIDLELIESSPSPEPPPPPIISGRTSDDSFSEKKEDDFSEEEKDKEKKEVTGFKDLKGVAKGRNYIRRNREPSTSPQKDVTGDVDHRLTGPPEKQPRLLFQDEKISNIEKSLVNVSGKDVDLRLLTVGNSSPGSKRLSTDAQGEEPPKKKNKTEVFDELFGNKDVDLRQMAPANLPPSERLPSPPPPPVISNGPPPLQVAAIAPLIAAEVSKLSPKTEEVQPMEVPDEDHSRDSFDSNLGRYRRAKLKPEAEIKPMSLSSQLELEIAPRKDPYLDTPEKDRKKNFRERGSPRGELDRLGRPLLYNKLPNDPRARRESLGVLDNRDTDMRRFGLIDRENDSNINVNMIVAQAEDQLRNGTMTVPEYNELLKQVIHVNEVQKMREAQNKSRQETRRIQYHHRSRRSPPNRFGPGSRNSPPYRHEDERRDRRPFNDIDERLPIAWRSANRNDPSAAYSRLPYPSGRSAYDIDNRNYDLKPEIWEDERARFRRAQYMDDHESDKRLRDAICTERTHDCVDVPEADESVLKLIAKDPMKSINIDGTPRDIRFYGDTAVVMLSWDEPKRISFEDGLRRVAINDQNFTCALNHDYTMVMIAGNPHRIRLGAPTREFYIDGEFYEVHFGGPPVQIEIDGRPCFVQLEGPPPQVKIGEKRTDLVCGRINIVVDATAILPLYLDAKPQRLDLLKRPYIFRFVDSLKTLLINETPVEIQFGGGCRQIFGYGNLHFIRLSTLPTGVIPGVTKILNMENINLPSTANAIEAPAGIESAIAPIPSVTQIKSEASVIGNSQQQPQGPGRSGPLDILTSLLSGTTASEQPVGFNYQVESQPIQPVVAPVVPEVPAPQPQPVGLPFLGGGLSINDLFQRLVATGIVPTSASTTTNQQPQSDAPPKPITFKDPSSLKERQPAIINLIYSGIQCSSCGVRFAPEETVKYSRHLDWHFRQNRREKDAARKGQSRKWYYDVSDWIQFEEIEDLEERAQSWFETEGTTQGDDQAEQEEIKSVPAPSGDENVFCELCRDQFDTFYNEEKEEWHLKPCVIVEEKYYHPFCYDDLINMPDESFADKTGDSLTTVKDESLTEESKAVEDEEMPEEPEATVEEKPLKDENPEEEVKHEIIEEEPVENVEEMVKFVMDEVINCVVVEEEIEKEKAAEAERLRLEEAKQKEIEVLEHVTVEQKKNIIDVDLIEALDEDDVVYERKTPSPILIIPPSKIKMEPVDEMESPVAVVDQTYTNVVASIDGNVEMIEAPQVTPAAPSKIKITFNKPIAAPAEPPPEKKPENPEKLQNDITQDEQDPEPLPLKPRKPALAGRELKVCATMKKGSEVSGLCSIM